MASVRKRGEDIRQFILSNVEEHPQHIATLAANEFGVSRQAINKHIKKLETQQAIISEGTTRKKVYKLHPLVHFSKIYELHPELAEDVIWDVDIRPRISDLPDNVVDIWVYGFTEMFNNAIDHSQGALALVDVKRTAVSTTIVIIDNGEGIFKKIQRELGLYDERQAVLELSKGKLTTDPERHSGEGIFFSSRMFDEFNIISGKVRFSHKFNDDIDWIFERDINSEPIKNSTAVIMELNNHTARVRKQVFDNFSSGDDYAFTKTVVPVRLAQYGNEQLVSRSQAKRMLARVDKFKTVIFDFEGVESIGQAFADEVFRVFKNQHPEIRFIPGNMNKEVEQMIQRAQSRSNS